MSQNLTPDIPLSSNQGTLFSSIPRYSLPTSIPFNRQTATTFIERLEELFSYISTIQEVVGGRDAAYAKLIDDANAAITSALASMKGMNDATEGNAQDVADKLQILNDALDNLDRVNARLDQVMLDSATEARHHVQKDHLFIDITDHGAVGDGHTDCTQAFNDSIALAGAGGCVYIPAGRYLVTGTISPMISQTIRGVGDRQDLARNSGSVILYRGNGVCIEANNDNMIECVIVENEAVKPAGSIGISHIKKSSFDMNNVTVQNFDTAFKMDSCWYGRYHNFSVFNARIGIDMNYSYNQHFFGVRLHPAGNTGQGGTGVNMTSRATVMFHGGSIEGFTNGIIVPFAGIVRCVGTYFETTIDDSSVAIRSRSNGSKTTILLEGCEVYLTNLYAFVLWAWDSGDKLVGIGNHFKSGTAGAVAYRFITGPNVLGNVTTIGDSWGDVAAGDYLVNANTDTIPPNSSMDIPYTGSGKVSGRVETWGTHYLGQYAILGQVGAVPNSIGATAAGAIAWNGSCVVLWTGSKWVRADGTAL